MKNLLYIIFFSFICVQVNAQTDTLKLKAHPEDKFLADWNNNILCTVDTSGDHEHFEIQFLERVKGSLTIKIYINNRLYKKFQTVIRKGNSYAFYYPGIIKNARVEYLDKTVYITK